MPELTRKWRFVVPFVMILLVITTMMGVACHNHDHCTSAACSFCHLAIDTPAIASEQRWNAPGCIRSYPSLRPPDLPGRRTGDLPARSSCIAHLSSRLFLHSRLHASR